MRFIKLMHFETVSMSDNSCARGLSYCHFLSHIRPFFGNNLGFSGKKSLKLSRFLNFVNLQNSKIFIGFFFIFKTLLTVFCQYFGVRSFAAICNYFLSLLWEFLVKLYPKHSRLTYLVVLHYYEF